MSVATDNVIEAARQSLAMTVEKLASPNDALALAAVATTSLFCDFITASASGAPQIVEIINAHIRLAGLQLVVVDG